jgi:branched-chain amino acid transport system permease protein
VAPARPRLEASAVLRWLSAPATLCAIVAVISLPVARIDPTMQRVVVVALINLVAVVGLYTFVGNSGVLSFGHLSFMAIGAYVSALLTIPVLIKHTLLSSAPQFLIDAHLGTLPALLIAGGAACAFALVVALPLMRLTGLAAGIATFAVLIIVNVVTANWDSVTRGRQTMLGVPLDTSVNDALLWGCVAIVIAYVFQESNVGLRLRGTREDEIAARAIGIGVFWERTFAFVVSAFLLGVAGALYGHLYGSFSPDAFYLTLTFLTMVMLVIGGINSLSGAVVGTIVVSAVSEFLRRVEQGVEVASVDITAPQGFQQIALALFLIAVLVFRPSGLTGGREFRWSLDRLGGRKGRETIPEAGTASGPRPDARS